MDIVFCRLLVEHTRSDKSRRERANRGANLGPYRCVRIDSALRPELDFCGSIRRTMLTNAIAAYTRCGVHLGAAYAC